MDTDLRIPMTSEQKSLIDEATRDEPEGKAAWARGILLAAARDRVATRESKPEVNRTKSRVVLKESQRDS